MEPKYSAEAALAELKERLRQLRTERRFSMAGLEMRAGVSHTTASQALNGPSVPSETTVIALAKALGAEAAPLLTLRKQAAGTVAKTLQIQADLQFGALAEDEADDAVGTPVRVLDDRDVLLEEALVRVTVVNVSRLPVQITAFVVEAWGNGALCRFNLMPEPLPAMVEPRSRIVLRVQKEPIDYLDAITFIGVVDGLGQRHGLLTKDVRALAADCWALPTRVFIARRRDDHSHLVATFQIRTPGEMGQTPVPDPPEVLATRTMLGLPLPDFLRLDELSQQTGDGDPE
ncbi:helix-turn-helix domain-containing protein [Streptomyces sp. NPDC056255]|uniref:helix-turn-helix domain-containing protein n=1 Tax=Streptomyces sp. NPDC056255 TaxID=3345764 RepID=UPI0035D739E2